MKKSYKALLRLFLLLFLSGTFVSFTPKQQPAKTVLLSILARNKEHVLPKYLQCIDALDYDKKLITIYINTNNNEDNTKEILQQWTEKNKNLYRNIIVESHEVDTLQQTRPHEWTATRFKVLGGIRNKSLQKTKECGCDYYFVVDCDNFITPCTLKTLIAKDKPIIAPFLLAIPEKNDYYSNYFCDTTETGYYKDHPDYVKIHQHVLTGTFKVPVVHCTYLIKADCIDKLNYIDDTNDYEFVIFSRNARKNQVDQYICNEQNFGVLLHFYEDLTLAAEKEKMQAFYSGSHG